MSDLKAQARSLREALDAKRGEAAAKWAEFDALRKSAVAEGVDFSKDATAFDKIDAAAKDYDTLRDEIAAGESKWARLMEIAGESAPESRKAAVDAAVAKTFGEAFTKSDAYKAVRDRVAGPGAIGSTEAVKVMDRAQMKTLLKVTSGGLSGVPEEDRTNLIVGMPLAGLDFLSVISTATTDSDLVEWIEETTYTNAAAETAEGSAAPESALAFTVRSTAVKDVTHFLPVTRRAMNDVAFVESWINNRLVDGVRRRLQAQILNGNGSGEDLRGIYNTSGIGSVDRSATSLNMEESLHKAITTIRTTAFAEPDFIGINPEDYETIRLRREGAGTGAYLLGAPNVAGPITLWGVPMIVHSAFTAGTPLVGVGREASLFVREGVSVAASDSHDDYFIKKQVALMASTRVAFAVTQPKAFAVSVA